MSNANKKDKSRNPVPTIDIILSKILIATTC